MEPQDFLDQLKDRRDLDREFYDAAQAFVTMQKEAIGPELQQRWRERKSEQILGGANPAFQGGEETAKKLRQAKRTEDIISKKNVSTAEGHPYEPSRVPRDWKSPSQGGAPLRLAASEAAPAAAAAVKPGLSRLSKGLIGAGIGLGTAGAGALAYRARQRQRASLAKQAAHPLLQRVGKALSSYQGAAVPVAAGALLGGGLGYLGSRPRGPEGKSRGEEKAEDMATALQQRPREQQGFTRKITGDIANFTRDVSRTYREHPVRSSLLSSAIGAALGMGVAKGLGFKRGV